MNGYFNVPPWWGYPPMFPPYPSNTPPEGTSIKKMIREWKAWEKFNKERQEEDKKKKDEKNKSKPPSMDGFYVFLFMTAASPIVGPIITALKDFIVSHLQ